MVMFPLMYCVSVLSEFQLLVMNEPIRESLVFCDIRHDFQTVLNHKVLNVNVSDPRTRIIVMLQHKGSSQNSNTHTVTVTVVNMSRQHVTGDMLINILKIGVSFEMFHSIKDMLYRGSLTEDTSLADFQVEISIFKRAPVPT
jgi:hypothetical protein